MSETKRSERDLLDFVDTAGIGLHWVAAEGTILWANPADYEPLGYSPDEYIGRNIRDFHVDANVIADIMRRLAGGERLKNFEARLRCKDGSIRQVLITSSGRFSESGEFLHTRCFTVDVSSRRPEGLELQVEALSREVERLSLVASREHGLIEAILAHSPHGIIVSGANGKLVLQNKAAERIWAGSATTSNVADWGKYRAFHPDGRPRRPEEWGMARALKYGETVQAEEVRIQRFDNTYGILLGSAAPIFKVDGEIDGALSVFADITRLKEQEEELRIGAERYLTTLKSIGDAVIATDAVGSITFMNPIAEELTGWTLADAREMPLGRVFRIVNESSRAEVESPVHKVIREGAIVGLANHTILIARDGTEIAIDDSGAPIRNSKGDLVGVVLVFRDVTEKRREEDRRNFIGEASTLLSSSLDYNETLASVANLAVPKIADWCAVDILEPGGSLKRLAVAHQDPGKVQLATEITKRYPPNPEAQYGVYHVIRTGESQLLAEIPESLLSEAAVDQEHLGMIRSLGLKSAMVVALTCRGRTLGAITFASDSSRRFDPADLSLAEELANVASLAVDNARLYSEAQTANRAKDEFLATVSHELRNPLNAMLGWAHLLRTADMSEEKRDHALEVVERNARNQAQLVEDLLDVSRIISGNLRLELTSVALPKVIEAAVDAVRPAADAKNVQVAILCDEQAQRVTGDAGRLQQVVWNLVSNAVKFTENGGTVTVGLTHTDSQAEIRVMDTGIGVEAKFLPHIFERFKQVDATSTRTHGGLGLGLAIVKHLVELHGGTVSVTSAGKGQGATFRVMLPLDSAAQRDSQSGLTLKMRISAPSLDGLRVLIVDDEPDTRSLLAAVLEGQGAEVQTVASAAEALREMDVRQPDVLVSDIGMPDEDGYSLIRKVRTKKKNAAELPAAALTAYARMEDRSLAMLAGFQAHIAKPVDPEELVIVVASLAGRTGGTWPPQQTDRH